AFDVVEREDALISLSRLIARGSYGKIPAFPKADEQWVGISGY
ncbi:unnamed protein product, partial [Rotaria magnacalcarata]